MSPPLPPLYAAHPLSLLCQACGGSEKITVITPVMVRLRVGPLVCVWYVASIIAVWTAKLVLRELPCPATLCAVQFAVAVVGSGMAVPTAARGLLHGNAEVGLVRKIALAYTLGFLLTNAAIAIAAPSFVETLKASEPLSTVAMASLVLGEHERWPTLFALLPIVIGVAMASSNGLVFSAVGMALALASNLAFSGRAVLTKLLKRDHPGAQITKSDTCLFFHVSRCGLCILVPCALVLDAGAWLASGADPMRLGVLLLLNGMAHALYNGVSFTVLAKVSIATHAVLNIVRRVLVIAVAAAVFATPVSAFIGAGFALSVLGVLAFAQSKSRGGGALRTRGPKNLLPV